MLSKKCTEVCPGCGRSDLYYEAGGYTGNVYHCKVCDYIGALVVEADEEMAKAIREDYDQRKSAKTILNDRACEQSSRIGL